jgi:UDP-2-acetamido-3-amino-2,3-dideoxy-glucuronate N-acetyltransferase
VVHVAATRRSFGIIKTAENALWSLAPHDIGLILNLVGRDPLTAQAVGDAWITQGVEDAAFARLVFEGGVVASISASWLHPVKEQSLVVVGQEGMAVFDDAAPWEGKLAVYRHRVEWPGGVPRARRAEAERIPLTPEPPLKRQCQAFLAAVESREGPPDSHGQEALRVLAVLSALSRSLAEGRPVALSEAAGGAMVHPTAVVDPGAVVGDGVRIWHFSHVLPGSVIGEGASLGQNVVVGPNVKVGPGCKIQNNVSVYEGVELEAGVFCGPSMVFTNVHNPRAFIRRMSEARPTLVRRGATIGANATIVCGNELGEHCFIAAGAVVSRPVPAHALMAGVPARRIGWVCRCGVRLPDSLECPACHLRYREEPGGLAEAPGG